MGIIECMSYRVSYSALPIALPCHLSKLSSFPPIKAEIYIQSDNTRGFFVNQVSSKNFSHITYVCVYVCIV